MCVIIENAPMGERLTEFLALAHEEGYIGDIPSSVDMFKQHFVMHVHFVCTRGPDACHWCGVHHAP